MRWAGSELDGMGRLGESGGETTRCTPIAGTRAQAWRISTVASTAAGSGAQVRCWMSSWTRGFLGRTCEASVGQRGATEADREKRSLRKEEIATRRRSPELMKTIGRRRSRSSGVASFGVVYYDDKVERLDMASRGRGLCRYWQPVLLPMSCITIPFGQHSNRDTSRHSK